MTVTLPLERRIKKMTRKKNTNETAKAIEKALCTNHNGKMSKMVSLSSSCEKNPDCLNRMDLDPSTFICPNCFSKDLQDAYPDLRNKLIANTDLLASRIFTNEELPILNYHYFRYESFGDLLNSIQVVNYFNLSKKNKHMETALWCKNIWHVNNAIKAGYSKPKNMNIGYSSMKLNTVGDWVLKQYNFIDFIFTVFTARYAIENDIQINCGNRICIECTACYKHHKPGTVTYINEILKADANIYYKVKDMPKEKALAEIDKYYAMREKRKAGRKYYKVKHDVFVPSTGNTLIENELLTEKERSVKAAGITDNAFTVIHLSQKKTFVNFGVRFEAK